VTRLAALTQSYRPADTTAELLSLSIGDLLEKVAAEIPDAVAVVEATPDPAARRSWTYRQVLAEARRAGRALAARFPPGSHIAVWSPNRWEFEHLQLGASFAGVVLVMVNPALKAGEVSYILEQSRSVALFYDDTHLGGQLASIAEQIAPTLGHLKSVHPFSAWDAFTATADEATPLPRVGPQDAAEIQYTSGTTGFPKGAVLRHGALVNNGNLSDIRSRAEYGTVFINTLPIFHVGAGTLMVIGAIVRRGTHVLMTRFDPGLALELIETYRGNMLISVPTVMQMMLEHPDLGRRDLSSLRSLFCGGGNVPAAMVERVKTGFGCFFTNGFGMTEAHGTAIQTSTDDSPEDQATTVGRPLPHVEVKITDPGSGAVLPIGELGEILLRGYLTMSGYYDNAGATANALDQEGWFHTGDLGSMDERGYVQIRARLKDMIIRGGENVYPAEVENVLAAHPDVQTVQVVGIDDEKWGEQVAAVLRLVEGAAPDDEAMYRYCRERMAAFKVPRIWYHAENFPMTASGKIQKFAIKEQIVRGVLTETWRVPSR
jgi:fatty-acyl-CoA synthase